MLLVGRTTENVQMYRDTVILLLQELGFVINLKKSVMTPSKKMEFLGLIINSKDLSSRRETPKSEITMFRFVSEPTSVNFTIDEGVRTSYVNNQGCPSRTTEQSFPPATADSSLEKKEVLSVLTNITLNYNSKQELPWWIKNLDIFNGTFLLKQAPQGVLQTDAPVTGWGTALQGKSIGRTWSFQERKLHTNELKLLAVKLALQTFLKSQNFTSIHIQMDNIVALTYLKKMGGTKNQKMTVLSKEIWETVISKQIIITVEYLPSSFNKVADLESCCKVDSSEWVLCRHVFHNLCLKLGTPTVDLFASRVSHQIPQYVVWKPYPYSIATDAMSIPWTQGHCYAFPPFCLLPRVLSKIQQDQVHTVTLITPCWQTQLWYPQVLRMLIRRPILMPSSTTLSVDPKGSPHR